MHNLSLTKVCVCVSVCVGGTVWEGSGCVDFLEKVCRSGWALRFQKTGAIPSKHSAS